MRKITAAVLAAGGILLAGCSAGAPRALAPLTRHDFGTVPVVNDMREAKLQEFEIRNEGTANLRLSDIQVKTIEGC